MINQYIYNISLSLSYLFTRTKHIDVDGQYWPAQSPGCSITMSLLCVQTRKTLIIATVSSYKIDKGFVVTNWPTLFNYFSGMVIFSQFTYFMPKLKVQNSTAAAVGFWILLSINIYLIPKFKIQNSTAAAVDFLILLSTII